ncbi:MAG: hypothetical protein AAF211_31070, partial [Myxococcota bacterium]
TLAEAAALLERGGEWLARRTMDRLNELIGPREIALIGIPPDLTAAGCSWRKLPSSDARSRATIPTPANASARW